MIGPIEVGQTWMRLEDGAEVRVTRADGHDVCFSGRGGVGVSSVDGFLRWYRHKPTVKPTIKLRIRVGVTADGAWLASDSSESLISGPFVAWHTIVAEVPMPETEQGETRGEVET